MVKTQEKPGPMERAEKAVFVDRHFGCGGQLFRHKEYDRKYDKHYTMIVCDKCGEEIEE